MNNLSRNQKNTLKAAVAAAFPALDFTNTAANDQTAAQWLSAFPATDFFAWRSSVPIDEVYDQVTWANLTPSDVPDGTAAYTNRALACQAKQINLQILLQGRTTINATKPKVTQGLQDALTAIPSGAGGATQAGGWNAVKAAISRKANRAEALLTGLAANGAPAATPVVLPAEGSITELEAGDIMRGE